MAWAAQKNSAVEMFYQIFLIVFLGCFQSAMAIDKHIEVEERFGANDILGFKIMNGEPRNGPFTVSTLSIFLSKSKYQGIVNYSGTARSVV